MEAMNLQGRAPIARVLSDAGIFLGFGIVIAIRCHHVIHNLWLYDDTYILGQITRAPLWKFFVSPEVWQTISTAYLTPWVSASLGLDLGLFGFNSPFFYLHHLFSIWLTAVVLSVVLRNWVTTLSASACSLLFVLSAPSLAAAEILSLRHYIEGLLFALLSLHLFVKAVRNGSTVMSVASALFYLLAMTAKELYVPVVFLMIFLPEGEVRRRLSYAAPPFLLLVLYFFWRCWMLGDAIGGPSPVSDYYTQRSLISLLRNLYASLVIASGSASVDPSGKLAIAGVLSLLPAGAGLVLVREKRYGLLWFFVVFFGVVYSVPLTVFNLHEVVAVMTEYRASYAIALFVWIIAVLSALCLVGRARRLRPAPLGAACSGAILVVLIGGVLWVQVNTSRWIDAERDSTIRPLVAEARFFIEGGDNTLMITSSPSSTYYYQNLEFLKERYLGRSSPLVVYNTFAFLDDRSGSPLAGLRVFTYDKQSHTMRETTALFEHERSAYLSRIRDRPLAVELHLVQGRFSYSVRSPSGGRFFVLTGYRSGLYCSLVQIGTEGKGKMATSMTFFLRFLMESSEGWVTISPEWFVDSSISNTITWSGDQAIP